MRIEVYSDGSATVASKPGGYGWVIVVEGVKKAEGNGFMPTATNNDAELEGAIQGLAAVLKMRLEHTFPIEAHDVYLVSDSEIVLSWANGTYRFKQHKKRHKYDQLMFLVGKLDVKTRWVQGHSGDEHNERCDKLANQGRKMHEISKDISTNTHKKPTEEQKTELFNVLEKEGLTEPVSKKTSKTTLKALQLEVEALRRDFDALKEELNRCPTCRTPNTTHGCQCWNDE